MPELPEVETVRRQLVQAIAGRRIVRARMLRPDLRRPFPPESEARLTGRRIDRLERRAKYITIFLDDGWVVLIHLGMSGRLLVDRGNGAPEPHVHVVLDLDDGSRVSFQDPRRFGLLDLVPAAALDAHPLLRDLGPEPLSESFTGAVLAEALKNRFAPIKAALMDQKTVAGLGNIYVCEALFRAGISPLREAAKVSGRRAAALVAAIKTVLEEAIAAGGSTLRDHKLPLGELGYFQHSFAVYGREGEPCAGCDCASGIRRITQAGRSTFYCAKRQR